MKGSAVSLLYLSFAVMGIVHNKNLTVIGNPYGKIHPLETEMVRLPRLSNK
jgi:hypothetical protein